ncbi:MULTISPECIES: transglutaminase-like cysteine peptidase [Corallincola]|uniref:transglutaminase-like cysteine peptidase n=1 Tax=Corallincola TaxID=1775176 RepID=UPI001F0F404E|nr:MULTISPECIES: transglutaminase-like cysteine peptidase [Corallincola]
MSLPLSNIAKIAIFLCGLLLIASLRSDDFLQIFSPALFTKVSEDYGDEAAARVRKLKRLLERGQNLAERDKLKLINKHFNKIEFRSDQSHWGKVDYWATPIELIATGAGDCEDYSIAKYFSLRALGVAPEKLRLMYVKAVRINQAHMVLTYYPEPDSMPLVLDNLTDSILPASKRKDLIPVYSFNAEGLWQSKALNQGKRVIENSQAPWHELLNRIESGY